MTCKKTTKDYYLEAMRASWGIEQVMCITGVTGLTGGESFEIATPRQKYRVAFDIDDASTLPTPDADQELVEVDLATGYTENDLAIALKSALEAVLKDTFKEFLVDVSSDGLSASVKNVYPGIVLKETTDVDSGFTFEVLRAGLGGELGKFKEGLELTLEFTEFEVKSDTTGETLLDLIQQASGASISASILETSIERIKLLIGNGYGNTLTPSGGTEVVGIGTAKNFQSAFESAGKLILHPERLEASDKSRDWVFPKCLPKPESINFSGTDTQAISASFRALVDDSLDTKVDVASFGDWTQDLRK